MPYSPYIYRYYASEIAPLRKIERLYIERSYYVMSNTTLDITCSGSLPHPPKKAKNVHFVTLWLIYENLVINYLPCCTYVSNMMKSEFVGILVPLDST